MICIQGKANRRSSSFAGSFFQRQGRVFGFRFRFSPRSTPARRIDSARFSVVKSYGAFWGAVSGFRLSVFGSRFRLLPFGFCHSTDRAYTDTGEGMNCTAILSSASLRHETPVSDRFIREIMPSAPDDAVRVYLYALMLALSGRGDASELLSALDMTEERLEAAFSFLQDAGAVRIINGENGNFAVQFVSLDAANEAELDAGAAARYAGLIEKLQLVLGTRSLSGAELKRIYDWIEIFRFDEGAAVEIVRRCMEIKGSRVHINYMDSVAKRLAADEKLTEGAVRENFEREKELAGGAADVLRRLRISRRPTEAELALYEKWTGEWGFSTDAVTLALDRTAASDRPNFKYLDAVLASLRESGGASDSVSAERVRELLREQDMLHELASQALKRAGLKRSANARDRAQFELWTKDYAMEPELILYAAQLASQKGSPFSEMKRLIESWHERGIASFQAAKEDAASAASANASASESSPGGRTRRVNRALGYRQQRYSAEQLRALGVDLGEDVYRDED